MRDRERRRAELEAKANAFDYVVRRGKLTPAEVARAMEFGRVAAKWRRVVGRD